MTLLWRRRRLDVWSGRVLTASPLDDVLGAKLTVPPNKAMQPDACAGELRSPAHARLIASTLGGLEQGTRMAIRYSDEVKPSMNEVVGLYRAVGWSSADKPDALHAGLVASHSLVTAWDDKLLVGLGSAISDGHLVVYFPHMVVRPEYQGKGIGRELMGMMMLRYHGFHQQVLLADGRAVDFYKKLGFSRAGAAEPLWIFDGHEHD